MHVHCLPNDGDLEPNNQQNWEIAEGHWHSLSKLNIRNEYPIWKQIFHVWSHSFYDILKNTDAQKCTYTKNWLQTLSWNIFYRFWDCKLPEGVNSLGESVMSSAQPAFLKWNWPFYRRNKIVRSPTFTSRDKWNLLHDSTQEGSVL